MEVKHPLFNTGRAFITPRALEALEQGEIFSALRRHAAGDWGECCPEDWEANDQALIEGARLFSIFRDRFGVLFWIITEADRSSTCVLLPDEY